MRKTKLVTRKEKSTRHHLFQYILKRLLFIGTNHIRVLYFTYMANFPPHFVSDNGLKTEQQNLTYICRKIVEILTQQNLNSICPKFMAATR